MPAAAMLHTVDPREALKKEVGTVEGIEIFNNQILVAVYQRPEKTAGGILLTDANRAEDQFQCKVGIVLQKGPTAFVDDEKRWFDGVEINIGDWVVFRPSDGWPVKINKQPCRVLTDVSIKARVNHPDLVW